MRNIIERAWTRIETWYTTHLPPHAFTFEVGATFDEIRRAEERLGLDLPPEVRRSYALHNGVHGCGLAHYGYLMSVAEAVSKWDYFRDMELRTGFDWPQPFDAEPDPAIKKVYWDRSRIPLTDLVNGNHVFLDLDPTGRGRRGQIIYLDRTGGPLTKLADGMGDWLTHYADDLEKGRYFYDADAQALIPEEQW